MKISSNDCNYNNPPTAEQDMEPLEHQPAIHCGFWGAALCFSYIRWLSLSLWKSYEQHSQHAALCRLLSLSCSAFLDLPVVPRLFPSD